VQRPRKRRGFSLIELLAALSVAGFVLLGGILLLDQLTDSGGRIVEHGLLLSREANGARLLRQIFLDTRVTTDSADRFRGDERSAEFSTSCQQPGGWLEQCRAALLVDQRMDSGIVLATVGGGDRVSLTRHAGVVQLRYFDPLIPDSAWTKRWIRETSVPLAVGVIAGGDTTVYAVGSARD
jgi:prepilin-type N-terminal cleavage/methylation domain-containing protein